nr:YkyB family protein [Thalassobacillus sp. CUG 92003]
MAESLFIVNRHAKTALEPKHLYDLKKYTIQKLLRESRAKKIGLHYSEHPKKSQQHSTLLIQVGNYYFHVPADKKDFQQVKHLGKVDQNFRNPKPKLSLSRAKKTLYHYLNWKAPQSTYNNYYSQPSMLGRMNVSPWNNRGKRTR